MRPLGSFSIALIVFTGIGLAAEPAPADAEREARVKALIADLGSDDFETRNTAEKSILAQGPEVVPALKAALAGAADAEIRLRLDRLLLALQKVIVVFETSLGAFEVELYPAKAPITVKNFTDYVEAKFYDGLLFHRVIDGFMIQGGGHDSEGTLKPAKEPIRNESANGLKNAAYSIAMARTADLDSATSQFFINVKDNEFLDQNQYCVFGTVVSGKETIDKIKAVPTQQSTTGGREKSQPVVPVVIKSARVKK